MKTVNKVLAAIMAVSLLSPTPAWAAKQNQDQAESKQSRFQQQLEYAEKGLKPLYPYAITQQKTKLQGWDEQSAEYKKAKKKQINVEKLPGEMEDVLKKAYDIFPELKELKVTEAVIIFEDGDRPELWGFEFEKEENRDSVIRARVTIEPKDGLILNYTMRDNEWEFDKSVTEKQAKEQSAAFLKKVLGKEAAKFKATSVRLYGKGEDEDEEEEEVVKYGFVDFSRLINNIPYANGGINVVIDGEGRVRDYRCDWTSLYLDESVFPDPKDAIKQKEAKKAYMKLEEMSLAYRQAQLIEIDYKKREEKTKPVLKYVPDYFGNMDAITGKEAEDMERNHREPSEKVELAPAGGELKAASREEAEKLLKDVFEIDVTGWEFDQYPEDDDDNDKRDYIRYSWYNYDKERDQEVELMINKETNDVMRFYYYDENLDDDDDDNEEDEVKITEAEAKKIALDTLQKYLPSDMKEGELILRNSPKLDNLPDWVDEDEIPSYYRERDYYFVLREIHQDVPIEDSTSWVRIDSNTGNVLSFGINRGNKDIKLPDNTKTVSPDKAEAAYVNNLDLNLVYVWPEIYDQIAPNPILIYTADTRYNGYIDAFTGRLVKLKEKNGK